MSRSVIVTIAPSPQRWLSGPLASVTVADALSARLAAPGDVITGDHEEPHRQPETAGENAESEMGDVVEGYSGEQALPLTDGTPTIGFFFGCGRMVHEAASLSVASALPAFDDARELFIAPFIVR